MTKKKNISRTEAMYNDLIKWAKTLASDNKVSIRADLTTQKLSPARAEYLNTSGPGFTEEAEDARSKADNEYSKTSSEYSQVTISVASKALAMGSESKFTALSNSITRFENELKPMARLAYSKLDCEFSLAKAKNGQSMHAIFTVSSKHRPTQKSANKASFDKKLISAILERAISKISIFDESPDIVNRRNIFQELAKKKEGEPTHAQKPSRVTDSAKEAENYRNRLVEKSESRTKSRSGNEENVSSQAMTKGKLSKPKNSTLKQKEAERAREAEKNAEKSRKALLEKAQKRALSKPNQVSIGGLGTAKDIKNGLEEKEEVVKKPRKKNPPLQIGSRAITEHGTPEDGEIIDFDLLKKRDAVKKASQVSPPETTASKAAKLNMTEADYARLRKEVAELKSEGKEHGAKQLQERSSGNENKQLG